MTSIKVREILNTIDKALLKQDNDAMDLWDVLTALRGPDSYVPNKLTTTVPIRRAAFPLTANVANKHGYGYLNGADFRDSPVIDINSIPVEDSHFFSHIEKAANVLGLSSREGK